MKPRNAKHLVEVIDENLENEVAAQRFRLASLVYRSRVFVRLLLELCEEYTLRYFQKVAFLLLFPMGTHHQPYSLPSCQTPLRKRFYNLARSKRAISNFPNLCLPFARLSNGLLKRLTISYVALSGKRHFLISRERDLERNFFGQSGRSCVSSVLPRASSVVNRKLRRQTLHRLRDSIAQTTHDCHTRECNLLRYRWI